MTFNKWFEKNYPTQEAMAAAFAGRQVDQFKAALEAAYDAGAIVGYKEALDDLY